MKFKDNKIILLLVLATLIIQVAECRRYYESRTHRRSRGSGSSSSSSSGSSDSSGSSSSGSHSGESHSRKRYRDSWEREREDRDSRERDRGNRGHWHRERWDRDSRERGPSDRDRWGPDSQDRHDYRERDAWNPFQQSPDKFPSTVATRPPARRPLPPFPTRATTSGVETITLSHRSEGQLPGDYDPYEQNPRQSPADTSSKKPFPSFSKQVPVDQVPNTKISRYPSQNDLYSNDVVAA